MNEETALEIISALSAESGRTSALFAAVCALLAQSQGTELRESLDHFLELEYANHLAGSINPVFVQEFEETAAFLRQVQQGPQAD